MNKFKFISKNKIENLPKNPGVYAFKKDTRLLYIGKAANIKERVKNHFPSRSEGERRSQKQVSSPVSPSARRTNVLRTPKRQRRGEKKTYLLRTQQSAFRDNLFINQVAKIGYIKTNSEITALILEANLIKKYQPKYNVVWRDDKNYFFVGIIKGDFPQVFITHQPKLKIENCRAKRSLSSSPSLLPAEARKLKIDFVGPFVDGKSLKKTLDVLRKIFPYRTCKTLPKRPCLWYQLGRCPAPCLLKSSLGKQLDRFTKSINWGKGYRRNIQNLIKILQGRKHQVIINLRKEMKGTSKLQDFEKAAKIRDQITAIEKVISHARIFEPQPTQQVNWPQIQKSLCQIFKINPPKFCKAKLRRARIEAYDISNIQGKAAAGAMVTFIDGTPNKNFYRRFKIKIAGKPNDIAMLKECLTRRLKHPEWPYPDLILIDGGRGQLNAAQSAVKYEMQNTKHKIQTMALAKKENKLFIENQKEPTLLKSLPREIFNLILQLRDEAHRFAISYHRKLRKKGLLEN